MMEGLGEASIAYSQEHTSTRFAAQAANRATVSAKCTRSPEDLKVVLMTAKTSGDSTQGVSHDIFPPIQDSFTTQGLSDLRAEMAIFRRRFSPVREPPMAGRAATPSRQPR
jgi:hypothetical protein